MTVAIKPLGRIPYDGLCVPLVSPDGRFIAVQTGPAPSWEAVLAQRGPDLPVTPVSAGIAVHRVTDAGLEPAGGVPARAGDGLLLGRSADDQGFLVESPRPDGARWIGRMPWRGGEITWLVMTPEVNAHAVLTAAGELLFTRSADGRGPAVLVCRTPAGVESTWSPAQAGAGAGLAAAFPVTGADPATAAVFLVGGGSGSAPGRLRVVGLRLAADAGGGVAPVAAAAARLAAPATVAAAYQAVVPVQAPAADAGGTASGGGGGTLLLFDSGRVGGVMVRFHPLAGSVDPLPGGSIAATAVREPGQDGGAGTLVAGPRGLMFLPETGGRAVSVVSGVFLPRATRFPGRVMLFGAGATGGDETGGFVYEVSVLLLGPDTGQGPAGGP